MKELQQAFEQLKARNSERDKRMREVSLVRIRYSKDYFLKEYGHVLLLPTLLMLLLEMFLNKSVFYLPLLLLEIHH
jgi:hypothetical protein